MIPPFGPLLGELLARKGLSQADLARISGLPSSAISEFISGLRTPQPEHLQAWVAALQLDEAETALFLDAGRLRHARARREAAEFLDELVARIDVRDARIVELEALVAELKNEIETSKVKAREPVSTDKPTP